MIGYFLRMDDMSPDYGTAMKSQWKTDVMEVSNNDLSRAYKVTGEVTQCGPYERYHAHVETNGWNELDHSQKLIAAGD